ncbi:hypothetical protein P3S68_003591 [Capsicum galapagoense]
MTRLRFGFLHQLQVLLLRNSSFTGSLPSSIFNITNLEGLDLTFNSLEDQIPKEIGSFINLRYLSLAGNNLICSIPKSISNASRLEILYLSYNFLQGNILEWIGNLHNLNTLAIESNKLTGPIPLSVFNISRIELIGFTNNYLSGNLPNGLCNRLPKLRGLYLSKNKLDGHMPTSLSNCSELQLLSLSENEFDGPIHSKIGRLTNLQFLFLRSYHFTGIISEEIGNLVNLVKLWVEGNQINGSVPIFIFNMSSLQHLSLTGNNLSGFLPREIGNLTKMQHLELWSNGFIGEIPKEISNLVGLEELILEFNSFSELYLSNLTNLVGTLPHSISNCSKLTFLELSNNKLTGLIPNSLGYLTDLQFLNLEKNNLTSDSSLSFLTSLTNCRYLTTLSLSLNPLNGILPVSVGNLTTTLKRFYVRSCKIEGRIPNDFGNLGSLLDLNLSENILVGSIPTSIGNLTNLQRFNLNSNKFKGFIGDHICKLQRLGAIYLGQNQLSGSLPNCLGNVTSLREIHLGSNKLSPNIQASLWALKDLMVLDLSSSNMLQGESISYYELLQATNALSESNLVGSGSFGSIYKGVLISETVIAVKVFNLQLDAAFKIFDTECEVLCSLRHGNLVKVITNCSNLDFKALVLDYMPNGSLEKHLYSYDYFLGIRKRLSIMIDVACALEYLHYGCSLSVIHCDLKPSNVLLDEDTVGHLSDFGILKLLGEDESDLYTKTLATLGYIASEYGVDGLVSPKCDIYSYGIMLLETFTRRKTNEFEGDLSLKQWVNYSLPEAVLNVVDANLVSPMDNHLQKELDIVASIMKVALNCCFESPA